LKVRRAAEGAGKNKCSFTHVDNYCHALILGEAALYPGSPALGQFYIATDGEPQNFWKVVDIARMAIGHPSLKTKIAVPLWLIMPVAHLCDLVGWCMGVKLKLTPFSVKMLVINRWFSIHNATRDLGYKPIISFSEGWASTIDWYQLAPATFEPEERRYGALAPSGLSVVPRGKNKCAGQVWPQRGERTACTSRVVAQSTDTAFPPARKQAGVLGLPLARGSLPFSGSPRTGCPSTRPASTTDAIGTVREAPLFAPSSLD
jgi:hypothetical protein